MFFLFAIFLYKSKKIKFKNVADINIIIKKRYNMEELRNIIQNQS